MNENLLGIIKLCDFMNNSDKIFQKEYKKLKESEEKFRKISLNAKDAIIQIDDRGVISYWNKAAENIFGFSENEALGKDLHTLIAPEHYHKSFLKGMKLFRKTGKGAVIGKTLEIEAIRKDGTEFPVELSISSIRVNESWNALAFIRDITERKQAEEKYEAIFEHSPIAIELYNFDGILINVNKACLDLFGIVDIKDLEKNKLFDDPNIPEKEKMIMKDGKTIRYEGEFDFDKVKQLNSYKTTKSGIIFLDILITPLYLRDKPEISNYLVQIQDITERKKIEQELENIFTLSPNMIGSAGNDAFFKRINPAVSKTLGYTDEELLSKSFIELIHPDDVESTLKEVQTLSEGKSTFNFVNWYRCKDGSYKWIEWNTKPIPEEEITYFVAQDVTGRKLTEHKLKEYSRNLEDIVEKRTEDIQKEMEKAKMYLDISAGMIIVINSDGNIELINKKGHEILGCVDEQLIGKNWFDNFIPKENKDEIKLVFRKLMAGEIEPVEYYENPILTRNGIEKIIAWHNTVVKDEQGNIIGFLGSGEDMTERKNIQKELQLERDNLINILGSMEDGVYIVDKNYDIEYVNPILTQEFGQYEGKKCYKFFHDRNESCPWCKIQEVLKGKTVRWEWYSPKNQKTYDLIDTPLINIDGSVSKLEIFRDITERKEASDNIYKTNRAYQMLSECNLLLVNVKTESELLEKLCKIVVEVGGYRLAWIGLADNNEQKTISPVAQAGFEDGYLESLNVTWADTERGRGPTGTAIRTGKACVAKNILTDPKFKLWREQAIKRGYVSSIALPLIIENVVIGSLNIYSAETKAFDIDEDEVLLKLTENLAYSIEKLRSYTKRKIVEDQLKLTMEDLKRSNTELEQFAYIASHDLQEPLRMISSFVQLLAKRYKDRLDEDADDFINFIVDGAKRMQIMINDLLTYSQIGRIDKGFRSTDTNIVLTNVLEMLGIPIEDTNATITHDSLPTILANERGLSQMFQNLISNAIKFHKEEEPPVVHISAKLQKNQWIFSIRDNGIGIDSQNFDRIFIIFQRLHTKDEYGGTGLGLAICKKIIERHNGKIWVESEVRKGSTFYFSIPKTKKV